MGGIYRRKPVLGVILEYGNSTHFGNLVPFGHERIRVGQEARRDRTLGRSESRSQCPPYVFVEFSDSGLRLLVEEELVAQSWERWDQLCDGNERACGVDVLVT